MYALRYGCQTDGTDREIKKSKGTKKSVVEKEIRFDHYVQTLESRVPMKHSQLSFKTDCHQIYTTRVTKTSLSALDTKRYILADGVTTNAYGHYVQGLLPAAHIPEPRTAQPEPKPVSKPMPREIDSGSKEPCWERHITCGGKYCWHFPSSDHERAEWMEKNGC